MIGLVIVSHSYCLAEGVKEVADQMAGGEIRIVAAGGLSDEDGSRRLGTDVHRIVQAIHHVWNDDGVLLLVDMGSAVLSTEMALEMLPATMRGRCLISNAPLVEGAIVAALQASLGQGLTEVNQAAEQAHTYQKVTR